MVVVAVHHIRHHTCFRNPMQETMLKGHTLVALIGVPVGFVAVKQAGYLNQVKLETQHIALFFKHRYRQTSRPLVEGTGIHHIKRMMLYKRLVVQSKYHPAARKSTRVNT